MLLSYQSFLFFMQFAHRICSSLFLFQEDRCLLIDILFCVLDFLVGECKVTLSELNVYFKIEECGLTKMSVFINLQYPCQC